MILPFSLRFLISWRSLIAVPLHPYDGYECIDAGRLLLFFFLDRCLSRESDVGYAFAQCGASGTHSFCSFAVFPYD
jgi:hypothetical protein